MSGWTYRPAAGVATVAQALLCATAALAAVGALLAWLRGFDPYRVGAGEALLWLVQLLFYAAAFVTALRWIFLANRNARSLGADDMIVRPGWAVAWFFVPLGNLFMPFVAMRELWKASSKPRDWQVEPAPAYLLVWWLLWVGAGVAGSIALRLDLEFGDDAAGTAETFYFASALLSVPALLLLARIIGGIQAMQARAAPDSANALRDRFA